MAFSIEYWQHYVHGQKKVTRKSEASVEAGRVMQFSFDAELQYVTASVASSLKDRSYEVTFQLGDAYNITAPSCTCALGNYECHHVAAALLFGYKHRSKTDVKCSWLKKPKSSMPRETKSVDEMHSPAKPRRVLNRRPNSEDLKEFNRLLCGLNRPVPMQFITRPEPKPRVPPVPVVREVINVCRKVEEQWPYLVKEELKLSREQIQNTVELTIGQGENSLWRLIRSNRITASKFGRVLSAIRRHKFSDSFISSLVSQPNVDTVRAIMWGIHHEGDAIKAYTSTGAVVNKTGIWLHPSGVLGASPDGSVETPPPSSTKISFQNSPHSIPPEVIEVKCPFSVRDKNIEEALEHKTFYLEKGVCGYRLKENHDYYHQIQGQLFITNTKCADLIVWTPKDFEIIRILRDDSWGDNITKLLDFYYNKFVHWIIDQE